MNREYAFFNSSSLIVCIVFDVLASWKIACFPLVLSRTDGSEGSSALVTFVTLAFPPTELFVFFPQAVPIERTIDAVRSIAAIFFIFHFPAFLLVDFVIFLYEW